STRTAPLGSAGLILPDVDGTLSRSLKTGAAAKIEFSSSSGVAGAWSGTIAAPPAAAPERDHLGVRLVSLALPLATTRITQTFSNETPEAIITWAIRLSGLAVGKVAATGMVLPHFIASDCSVVALARQLALTCQRSFDLDMSAWKLWLGAGGVNWGDFDEPGSVPTIASGEGLLLHAPTGGPCGLGAIETFLLPDLTHSRRFHLRDSRRGIDASYRALHVRHSGTVNRVRTHIFYGAEHV
ncbi:MAG: hypothetical protein Q8M66_06610, partial [Actinomycetota bacterium]|nr:hypothetical protein [Actinomycetota bacterium]